MVVGVLELESLAGSTVHSPSENKAWFEKQDKHTLHRPIRKIFPRNQYSANNVKDDWEFELVDVHFLTKYNDKIMFLLSVINFFSKYVNVVPLKSKTRRAVTFAFETILKDPNYLNPLLRGRSGSRRIGETIFIEDFPGDVEARRNSISRV